MGEVQSEKKYTRHVDMSYSGNCLICYGKSFTPFGEMVHEHKDVFITTVCSFDSPQVIHGPKQEWFTYLDVCKHVLAK